MSSAAGATPAWMAETPGIAPPVKPAGAHRLAIYSINDVYVLDLMPTLKTFIDEHRARADVDEIMITCSGDFLSPSTLALFDNGATMVRALNALGADVVTWGNHEFDIEWPQLQERLKELDATIINSNIHFTAEHTHAIRDRCQPLLTRTLANGAVVSVLGYLTEETEENMRIVAGDRPLALSMDPVVGKAREDVELVMRGRGAEVQPRTAASEPAAASNARPDYLVAMTHQFLPFDRAMSARCGDVNLVLGGHEHDPFVETIVPDEDGAYAAVMANARGALEAAPAEPEGDDDASENEGECKPAPAGVESNSCAVAGGVDAESAAAAAGVVSPAAGLMPPALARHSSACEVEFAMLQAAADMEDAGVERGTAFAHALAAAVCERRAKLAQSGAAPAVDNSMLSPKATLAAQDAALLRLSKAYIEHASARCPACKAKGPRAVQRLPDPVALSAAPPVRMCKAGSDSIYCLVNIVDFVGVAPAAAPEPVPLALPGPKPGAHALAQPTLSSTSSSIVVTPAASPTATVSPASVATTASTGSALQVPTDAGFNSAFLSPPSMTKRLSTEDLRSPATVSAATAAAAALAGLIPPSFDLGAPQEELSLTSPPAATVLSAAPAASAASLTLTVPNNGGNGLPKASCTTLAAPPSLVRAPSLSDGLTSYVTGMGAGGCEGGHDCRTVRASNVILDGPAVSVTHTSTVLKRAPRPVRRRHAHSAFVTTTTTQLVDILALRPHLAQDAALLALYEEGQAIIEKSGSQVLYTQPEGLPLLTSRNVRDGPNTMARFLAAQIKSFYACDAVLLPAGKVRGNKDYSDGAVKYIDVMAELPFADNQVMVVQFTGAEIDAVVSFTYQHHVGRGGFIQTDPDVVYSAEEGRVTTVNGKALDAAALYSVAVPLTQLKGMDGNKELIAVGKRFNVASVMGDDLLTLQHVVIARLTGAPH